MARRLAAIVFTDITGYASLTHRDERAALRLLREQEELFLPVLEVHRGRRVKSIGDGLLIEFPNALDAVECSMELQQRVTERNARPGLQPLRLRVGIHLGDVQEVESDIYGDAVNIASRIEPLASPEGVCISEPVYVQVRNKVPYGLQTLGPKTLKGIDEPVEVYRVLPVDRPPSHPDSDGALGLRTRLAVLPLANISPDPKDEYFADGLTEELITVLSQLQGLEVIARTSVAQYKSTPRPIAQIGIDLGVASVLEGSVRKAGDRLRITVQLIDVASQGHLWARTYDRNLDDIFAVQAEVATEISKALKVRLAAREERRLEDRPSVNADSYLAYLKGRHLMSSLFSSDFRRLLQEAKQEFLRAISLDERNAAAYSGLADATAVDGTFYHPHERAAWGPESKRYAVRALELDPELAEAHGALGHALQSIGDLAGAEQELQRALALSPSYSWARQSYADLLMTKARPDEALQQVRLAEGSDPRSVTCLAIYAYFLTFLGRLDEAQSKIERLRVEDREGHTYFRVLAEYLAARADYTGALAAVDRMDTLDPENRFGWLVRVYCLSRTGRTGDAWRLLVEREGRGQDLPQWLFGLGHAYLGDLDGCFRFLSKSVELGDMYFPILRNDTELRFVREDPRFDGLLMKAGVV